MYIYYADFKNRRWVFHVNVVIYLARIINEYSLHVHIPIYF